MSRRSLPVRPRGVLVTSPRVDASAAGDAARGSTDWVEALRACRGETKSCRDAAVKARGPPILRAADRPCRATPLLRSAVPNCREGSRVEDLGRACVASRRVRSTIREEAFRQKEDCHSLSLRGPRWGSSGEGLCWEASCLAVREVAGAGGRDLPFVARQNFQVPRLVPKVLGGSSARCMHRAANARLAARAGSLAPGDTVHSRSPSSGCQDMFRCGGSIKWRKHPHLCTQTRMTGKVINVRDIVYCLRWLSPLFQGHIPSLI